jgi:hypothetical protein
VVKLNLYILYMLSPLMHDQGNRRAGLTGGGALGGVPHVITHVPYPEYPICYIDSSIPDEKPVVGEHPQAMFGGAIYYDPYTGLEHAGEYGRRSYSVTGAGSRFSTMPVKNKGRGRRRQRGGIIAPIGRKWIPGSKFFPGHYEGYPPGLMF